jgi:ABC-type phosphate transport system substrate-binding protein
VSRTSYSIGSPVRSRGKRGWLGARLRMLVVASVAAGAALAVVPSVGQANFTTGKCLGADTTGRGASFANTAHTAWETNFETDFCAEVGSFPEMTYDPAGSGAGRRAMGERTGSNADGSQSRNQVPRFGMSDEPPSTTGQSQMNMGTDAAGDEGIIHVLPGAVGSVVLAVNFPNNCDRSLLPDTAETNPASANSAPFIDRVRFTRTQFEAIWNGDSSADQWTDVFPTLASDTDCNVFITRVVRFDDSGTSFAFKDYLDSINPVRGWLTTYTTPDTRTWPNASVGARPDCGAGINGPTGTHLTSGCANGNGSLVQKLLTIDGGIGYSDIATARTNGYAITPGGSRDDDLFWTQVQNQSSAYVEPTADPNGFRTDGLKGANCLDAVFTGVPTTGVSGLPATTGDWSNASGVDSPTGYVICTLTYGLAFDDNKPAYALQPDQTAEEAKARSVKDYWTSIISDEGQATLFANDYAPLPPEIAQLTDQGVTSICWNKAGGACPSLATGYARPKSATPTTVKLVVAHNQCGAPNSTHGAPLALPSCNPPVKSSTHLTVGTPDTNGKTANFTGSIVFKGIPGNAGTPADEADVQFQVDIRDVRKNDLTDYTGQLRIAPTLRITDRYNGATTTRPGTVQDTTFPVDVTCVATPGPADIGSTCAVNTTADAIEPGSVLEIKRSVWQLGQVQVFDGGADGVASTTGDNTLFLTQGAWIP